jgi:hypothetical protein
VAAKKKNRKGKGEKKSRMASPLRGNGVLDSLLSPPAGDVANVGGVLARFERAFKNDPTSLQNLDKWDDWLFHLYTSGDSDDANVQRAGRLGEEIHDYRENSCADEWVNDDCPF